jgi:hypothetical protein
MISQHHQHRRNRMTLPTNDDCENCELSIEELEAIAAGGFWSTLKQIGEGALKVAFFAGVFLGGYAWTRNAPPGTVTVTYHPGTSSF